MPTQQEGQSMMSAQLKEDSLNGLTPRDIETLRQSFIPLEIALEACIYRVSSEEGASIVGRKNNNSYSGIIFPYRYPGCTNARDYRLRRDTPDIEYDATGKAKEKAKYLGSPGARNKLYYPPTIPTNAFKDPSIDIVITEGEKKCLALYNLGLEENLNWFAIGLSGVWNWRGTIGKTDAPFGGKQEVKGTIPDLDEINCDNRRVYIVFDRNVHTNESVKAARQELIKELKRRGAKVLLVNIPEEEIAVNGIDDLLFQWGTKRVLQLFQQAEDDTTNNALPRKKIPANSEVTPIISKKYSNQLAYDVNSKEWLTYTKTGIWQVVAEEKVLATVKDKLTQILPEVFNWYGGFSWQYLQGVIKMLQIDFAIVEWQEKPNFLPMLNGVLHLATMKLHPPDPKYYLRWQLPYNYEPYATCPNIEQWILETAKGDESIAKLLRAFLKVVVTGRTDLQRYLELLGPAGTGKSTFMKLAMALVGLQNVFVTELKQLENNRFETSNLYGKRLMVVTDAERHAGSVSTLKAIVGQDPIRNEKKFENASRPFIFRGNTIVAANETIQTSDYTSGLERRRLSVPFKNQIAPTHRRNLIEFNTNGDSLEGEFIEELPGLLNWVLSLAEEEVIALIRDTDKNVPSLAVMKREVLTATNPLADWVDNNVVYDPIAKTQIGTAEPNPDTRQPGLYLNYDRWLYPNYRHYAETTGNKPVAQRRFSDLLEDFFQSQLKLTEVYKVREKTGTYFIGLRLRTSDNDAPSPLSGQSPNNQNNSKISETSTPQGENLLDGKKLMKDGEESVKPEALCFVESVVSVGLFQLIALEKQNGEKVNKNETCIKVVNDPTLATFLPQLQQNKELDHTPNSKLTIHHPSLSTKQVTYNNEWTTYIQILQTWLDNGLGDSLPPIIRLANDIEIHNPKDSLINCLAALKSDNAETREKALTELFYLVTDINDYLAQINQQKEISHK